MLIATDFLWVGFSSPKTFNLRCMPPPLSFCAEPNGEVAESILQRITLLFRERRDGRRWWERAREEHFPPPLIRPGGHLLPREKVVLHKVRQWILQLRASPSCRMTWVRVETATNSVGLSSPRWIMSRLQYAESWADFNTLNHEQTSIKNN